MRSYAAKAVSKEAILRLEALFSENTTGPFNAAVRFQLLDLNAISRDEWRRYGTYGVIKGARLYILGAVKIGERAQEDLGYCMEKIILEATEMGLGTCWMGGTFRRSSFAGRMNLASDEILPAISPVGYPADAATFTDQALRYGAGSDRRKPWDVIFFDGAVARPLTKAAAGDYSDVLEAVRLGPSASNRQPWRIIMEQPGCFHLYLKENRVYNRIMGKVRIQNIDMGIAMCHFELAAREHGLAGRWVSAAGPGEIPGLEHIATWIAG